MLDKIAAVLTSGWTPGAVGIYGLGIPLLAIVARGVWTSLPQFLDALTRRADAEAKRIDGEFMRLERQILASDKRHEECEARCEIQQVEISGLRKEITGLHAQIRQIQISAIRLGGGEVPTVTAMLIAELDNIPSGDFKQ